MEWREPSCVEFEYSIDLDYLCIIMTTVPVRYTCSSWIELPVRSRYYLLQGMRKAESYLFPKIPLVCHKCADILDEEGVEKYKSWKEFPNRTSLL